MARLRLRGEAVAQSEVSGRRLGSGDLQRAARRLPLPVLCCLGVGVSIR